MDAATGEKKKEELPPGFRFHPTDEELITCYLISKISDSSFTGRAIADVDLNKCEPWDLPAKAKMGEKEWYFFSLRDRKYPTGVRTNRATSTGYWKTTGKDKEIFNSNTLELIGMKKTLVFYRGRAPRGEKSNWVMHEYRIHSKSVYRSAKDEWVVCRVFQKSVGGKTKFPTTNHHQSSRAINIEIGPDHVLPQAMMPIDPAQFQMVGRPSYVMGNNHHVEFADLSRNLRSNIGSTSANFSIQPHLNYPVAAAAGGSGCFMSGLNLNLGGNAGSNIARPMMVPPSTQPAMNPHDVNPANVMAASSTIAMENGFGVVDLSNNGNGPSNRFVNMDHCVEFDGYWPNY